ncbi:MAG: hypothetical protein R3C45_07105 [Phycisphaerales bacterium]
MQRRKRNLCRARGHVSGARCGLVPAGIAALCLLPAPMAHAATTVWTGSSAGGVFNDDANWSGVAPIAGDLGIFNSATNVNGTVTFNADATHLRTFVQNNAGTIAFDTGANTWTMTSYFLTGTSTTEDNHIQFIGGHIVAQFYLMGNTAGATNGDIIEVIGPTHTSKRPRPACVPGRQRRLGQHAVHRPRRRNRHRAGPDHHRPGQFGQRPDASHR